MPTQSELGKNHADTLAQIFAQPASHNIRWEDVVKLVTAAGSVDQRHDGRFKFTIGTQAQIFDRPRNKDIDIEMLEDLRHMFRSAGMEPTPTGRED